MALLLTSGSGCQSFTPGSGPTTATASGGSAISTPAGTPATGRLGYVSIGDSYAAGYQPISPTEGRTTRNGFAYQVVDIAAASGIGVDLVNFGCSGATSSQILHDRGCEPAALGPDAQAYPDQTQADAALAYVSSHRERIALVTVIMGGNDISACMTESDPRTCVNDKIPVLRTNLDSLLNRLRAVLGDQAKIVGLTYPDVFLGVYLTGGPAARERALDSRDIFKEDLNAMLADVYAEHGAAFVDITRLTGAYEAMSETTDLYPYGKVPVAVAQICRLTYFCDWRDVHPKTEGHRFIAHQVVEAAQ